MKSAQNRSSVGRSSIRARQLKLEQFESRRLMAADFVLTKDINTGFQDDVAALGTFDLCPVGSTTFMVKSSTTTGTELWKTDGTIAGTSLVKDLVPGTGSSAPSNLVNFNGTLFFRANDGTHGFELWKSDGTEAGTVLVKDIAPGPANGISSVFGTNAEFTVAGSQLFFVANDGTNGSELWKTDGTDAGTVMVKNISPTDSNPNNFANVNGILFFAATEPTVGRELYRSDGTAAGTFLIRDIVGGVGSSAPSELTNVNGLLFFNGNNELFRSNGTSAGTTMVANLNPTATDTDPIHLTNHNGTLYFVANDGVNGAELWKSNGNLADTVMVKDINTTGDSSVSQLTSVGSTLFLRANDGTNGVELWKSDGTAAGTVQLRDINFGPSSSAPTNLLNVGGTLFFQANDGTDGVEVWKSNGTGATTLQVVDAQPGATSSQPTALINANGLLMFTAFSEDTRRVWRSNGVPSETYPITPATSGSSLPTGLTVFNGLMYFSANDGMHGDELWVSDGTTGGTRLFMDINPGTEDSLPKNFYPFNGHLYFQANDGAHGAELWRTDGTIAGTVLVRDIHGTSGSTPSMFTEFGGRLFFSATDGATGLELWVTDGTLNGTALFKAFDNTGGADLQELVVVNNTLYIWATSPGIGSELWKSDGTVAGTVLIKDLNAGIQEGILADPTPYKGELYFVGNDGSSGRELFRSNGTAAGTTLVKDTNPGLAGSVDQLIVASNILFFTANDGSNGVELWRSDGSPAGTFLLKDLAIGSAASNPRDFAVVGDQLYFTADDGVNGRELWRTNGTAAGTLLVKDIQPGLGGSAPTAMTNVNGKLYFQANTSAIGSELWTSDGTDAGTQLRKDFAPGSGGSQVSSITQMNDRLFVVATDEVVGRELWMLDPDLHVSQSGASPRSLRIDRAGANLNTTNVNTSTVIQSQELAFTRSVTIDGETTGINQTNLVYNTIPFFILPDGIQINGQAGATDAFLLDAPSGTFATYRSAGSELGTGKLAIVNSGLTQDISFNELESLSLTGLQALNIDGPLPLSNQSLTLNSNTLVNLSSLTQLNGGTIQSSGLLALGSGELLTGAGNVSGRMAGDVGSSISASGALSLGNSLSSSGFITRGDLSTGANTITLLDSNEAVLGSETLLGVGTVSPGTVVANNGLLVDFGNNVVGFGTLSTLNSPARPLINNGTIAGLSTFRPVTLTGFIKGVGTLTNVTITGTFSPGFSPAAVALGSLTYAAGSTTIVELGGTIAGTQHDQLNHSGRAVLGGTLNVQLINGFQPALGDSFTIITADTFEGNFASIQLPTLPSPFIWRLDQTANAIRLSVDQANVAPTNISLSSSSIRENLAAGNSAGSFFTQDANAGDTFVVTLVSGAGSTDNARFTIDAAGNLKTASSFNFETQSSYTIRVRSTDQGGLFVEQSFVIAVIDLPELVGDATIGDGTAQRSLVNQAVITFDGLITFDAGAFSINRRGVGGGAVSINATNTVNGQGQSVVTLSFTGAMTRGANGALQDGYYQLNIDGTKIHRGSQTLDVNQDGTGGDSYVLGDDEVDNFFALYGDTNGDGIVGVAEFGQFRTAFGKLAGQPGYSPQFDFEGDGVVGIADFGQFRSRFGKPKLAFV